jgi:succinylarginine dihydrolase
MSIPTANEIQYVIGSLRIVEAQDQSQNTTPISKMRIANIATIMAATDAKNKTVFIVLANGPRFYWFPASTHCVKHNL